MQEDFSEYNELVQQLKALSQETPPSDLTQVVMGRLDDFQHSSIRQLLIRTIRQTGEISLSGFVRADSTTRDVCFSFFVTGLFFFLIGSILFCSVLLMGYKSGKAVLILIPSILILMAAISLFIGGLIVAVDSQASAYWAKRAIMVYGGLMILNVVFVISVVQTVWGGILALAFGVAVIVMGITLLKAIEISIQGGSTTFRKELHNV